MITLLLRPEDLAGTRVDVEGASYRHLFRARRLPSGARLRVVDGRGRARWATVEQVERRRAVLRLAEPAADNEPHYALHLRVAALRAERASWLIEKATEIGVRSIHFVATERTPRRYAQASLERLRRVARAAVEQCHRSMLPVISGVEPWEAVTAALAKRRAATADRFVLDPAAPGSGIWRPQAASGFVWVGPEGGFSPGEISELEDLGCSSISLGGRTLRAETAAICGAAKLLLHPRKTC